MTVFLILKKETSYPFFIFQVEEINYGMWLGMTAIAFLGLVGYTTNTECFKVLDPTTASFFRSLQIIFGEVTQILVFKNIPSFTT